MQNAIVHGYNLKIFVNLKTKNYIVERQKKKNKTCVVVSQWDYVKTKEEGKKISINRNVKIFKENYKTKAIYNWN